MASTRISQAGTGTSKNSVVQKSDALIFDCPHSSQTPNLLLYTGNLVPGDYLCGASRVLYKARALCISYKYPQSILPIFSRRTTLCHDSTSTGQEYSTPRSFCPPCALNNFVGPAIAPTAFCGDGELSSASYRINDGYTSGSRPHPQPRVSLQNRCHPVGSPS